MGTGLCDEGTRLVALNSRGWYVDLRLSISGWAGGVVTPSTRWEDDARNISLWEDGKASTEGRGASSASAVSRY